MFRTRPAHSAPEAPAAPRHVFQVFGIYIGRGVQLASFAKLSSHISHPGSDLKHVGADIMFQVADSVRKCIPAIGYDRYPARWKQVLDVEKWLSANSRPDAVVIPAIDPLMYLGSARNSIRGFYGDPLPTFY